MQSSQKGTESAMPMVDESLSSSEADSLAGLANIADRRFRINDMSTKA
jgi:hypothetical protein